MKLILDLKLSITEESFIPDQFKINGTEKNILWVNPQLSVKHLYKVLLPLLNIRSAQFKTRSGKVATAITSLSEYNEESQLFGENEWQLTDEMINWGKDKAIPVYIVFPFTTQPLVSEVYKKIREMNPFAHIVYMVDFDFYSISENHPYKYIFNEPTVISSVEDNMYFADLIMVTNYVLEEVLINKINQLANEKYNHENTTLRAVRTFRIFDDLETTLENVDYDIQKTISSIENDTVHSESSNELIEKITETAKKVRVQKKISKTKTKPANGSTYKGTPKNKLKKQIKKAIPDGKQKKRNRSKRPAKK